MNKIMKIIASVLVIFVLFFTPNFTEDIDEPNYIYEWDKLNTSLHDTTWEMDEYIRLLNQMNKEIAAIPYDFENIDQKMSWFITYKGIISKYPQEIHNTTTIYDTYSSAELDLLFRIVQCEVGDEYDFDEKTNVVSVIFNRCHKYNASITQVLTAKKQFTPYLTGVYKNAKIDKKTILACEYVFMFGDTTNGCMYFRSHKKCPENWNGIKQFSDDAHCFYK